MTNLVTITTHKYRLWYNLNASIALRSQAKKMEHMCVRSRKGWRGREAATRAVGGGWVQMGDRLMMRACVKEGDVRRACGRREEKEDCGAGGAESERGTRMFTWGRELLQHDHCVAPCTVPSPSPHTHLNTFFIFLNLIWRHCFHTLGPHSCIFFFSDDTSSVLCHGILGTVLKRHNFYSISVEV